GKGVEKNDQKPREEENGGEIGPSILVDFFFQKKENPRDQGKAPKEDKKTLFVFERTKSRAGVGNIYQIEPARNNRDLGFDVDVMQNPILADLIERIERQREEGNPLHILNTGLWPVRPAGW